MATENRDETVSLSISHFQHATLGLVPDIVAKQPEDWKTALNAKESPTDSEVSPHKTLSWLINDKMGSSEVKAYFNDVIVDKKTDPVCPFDYRFNGQLIP